MKTDPLWIGFFKKGSLHGSSFRGHNTKGKPFACLFWKKLYPFYWNKYKELEKTHSK